MGTKPRPRPTLLGVKLLAIRKQLGLSQSELIFRLRCEQLPSRISEYESGVREPPLFLLLRYARLAGVCTCALIDDDLSLSADVSHASKKKRSQKQTRTIKDS
jgi:transcriptional regulator with XRE-family HTH domain